MDKKPTFEAAGNTPCGAGLLRKQGQLVENGTAAAEGTDYRGNTGQGGRGQ
jgi:hypothetical protein